MTADITRPSGPPGGTPTPRPPQVCQAHGAPDDLVVCPYRRCQMGRVPLWSGYGMPAGTRACTVCDGHGRITRADARKAYLPLDDTWTPFCICSRLAAQS